MKHQDSRNQVYGLCLSGEDYKWQSATNCKLAKYNITRAPALSDSMNLTDALRIVLGVLECAGRRFELNA